MKRDDTGEAQPHTRPRAATVFIFLAAFAVMASWLSAYAVPSALIAGHLMTAFPSDEDPRPRWMLWGFCLLFGGVSLIGAVMGWRGHRQLQRIDDQMFEEVDPS